MKPLIFFLIFFSASAVYAQRGDSVLIKSSDTLVVKKDTAHQKKIKRLVVQDSFPNPKRALLYSIIPGGGQIYNRKLWFLKLPLVYGGLGFGVYQISQNAKGYNNLKLNYYNSVNNLPLDNTVFPNIKGASTDAIKQNRDVYYKALQESYIFTFIGYLLTGLEAFTTAHLAHFDVKNDIGLHLKPNFETIPMLGQTGGIGLTYTFK